MIIGVREGDGVILRHCRTSERSVASRRHHLRRVAFDLSLVNTTAPGTAAAVITFTIGVGRHRGGGGQ